MGKKPDAAVVGADHTTIQSSLINKDIYYICHTAHESLDHFGGELCTLRRKFFSGGGKRCSLKKQGEYMGCGAVTSGSMHCHSLKWRKTVGKVRVEEAFYMGRTFVVVCRDLNGTICGKIHYDRDLRWTKTEYFTPEDYMNAKIILKPRESSDGVELFTYDANKKSCDSKILYPVPYRPGDAAQSILNAKYGAPELLVATQDGEFVYCGKDEQKKRLKDLEALEKGSMSSVPDWEDTPLEQDQAEPEETEAEGVAFQSLFEAGCADEPGKNVESDPLPAEIALTEDDLTLEVETPDQPADSPATKDAGTLKAAPQCEAAASEAPIQTAEVGIAPFSDESLTVGLIEEGERFNYTGRLMSGKRQGRGRTDQPGGLTVFDGTYQDGLREGFGATYSPEGALSYAGFWKQDQKDGGGVSFRESDQAMHVTTWEAGKPGPQTALFDAKGGLRYYGRICGGKKIGAGVTMRGDSVFVGKYKGNGEPAEGALFDSEGNLLYSGGWKDNMRHGEGIEFDLTGQVVYAGQWREDKYLNGVLYKKIDEA